MLAKTHLGSGSYCHHCSPPCPPASCWGERLRRLAFKRGTASAAGEGAAAVEPPQRCASSCTRAPAKVPCCRGRLGWGLAWRLSADSMAGGRWWAADRGDWRRRTVVAADQQWLLKLAGRYKLL